MPKRTPRAKATRATRKAARSRSTKTPPRKPKAGRARGSPERTVLPPLDERLHYDFTDADVVDEIGRLAAIGTSERVIAWRFGYKTAAHLRAELAKPEHRPAFRALVRARVELEVELCARVLATARNPIDLKTGFAAQRWLLENRIAGDEEHESFEIVEIPEGHSDGFVDELRGQIH